MEESNDELAQMEAFSKTVRISKKYQVQQFHCNH